MSNPSHTNILPMTTVKEHFAELIKKVETYRESITVTKNGVPAAILMNIEEFECILETLEILSDPKIMASLKRSEQQEKKGKLYTDDEVWD